MAADDVGIVKLELAHGIIEQATVNVVLAGNDYHAVGQLGDDERIRYRRDGRTVDDDIFIRLF